MKIRDGRFIRDRVLGSKNNKWRGDNVGYYALHQWVQRQLGVAKICSDCNSSRKVEWANISKKYKRDVVDWKQLCSVCHRRFDGITKFSKIQARQIKIRYHNGEKQIHLAREYQVDQGTISHLVNNKIQFYVI